MGFRGLALLMLLAGAVASARDSAPTAGRVVIASVEVFDRPDATGFVVAELARGTEVAIDHASSDGWVAIEPPPAVFCWLDEGALDRNRPGTARVVVDSTTPRSANALAKLPGRPLEPIGRGTTVTVLARKPCIVPQSAGARVFVAIKPPPGHRCYVREEAIRTEVGRMHAPRVEIAPMPIDPAIATPGNSLRSASLPPALMEELSRVEAAHRAVLRAGVESWDLDAVKRSYQDLANRFHDADSRALLEGRIARVDQQSALAVQARRFEMLVRESRTRDSSTQVKESLVPAEVVDYDAVGMLQRSSKLVDGKRVYALVGDGGSPVAYLSVPPGLLVERYLSAQVGVRGQVHYDAYLRNQVIDVEELTPLVDAP